jgi:hypothetical protein
MSEEDTTPTPPDITSNAPTVNVTPVPVTPPPQPTVVTAPSVTPTTPTDVQLGKNICPDDTALSNKLSTAFAVLANVKSTGPAILGAQITLYNILIRYLTQNEESISRDFILNLLSYIEYNEEVHFTSKLKFREFDKLSSLNTYQQREFTMILYVLIDVAPVSTRVKAAREIRWDNVRMELLPSTADIIIDRLRKFLNAQ